MTTFSVKIRALVLFGLVGCAAVPNDTGLRQVQELTAARLDHPVQWREQSSDHARIDDEVRGLLAAPLTAASAVQVALLENPGLQAEFERLGIARADLVQAGLLRNPVLSASARVPDTGSSHTNLEFGLVQGLLDVLVRPVRRSIATAQFQETKLSVAAAVLELASDVRRAYFTALGASQIAELRMLVVQASEASAELAHRLHGAGNISDLQLANEIGLYESARVAWARADVDRIAAREDLTLLMGLWGESASWTLPASLPPIPLSELPLQDLEARAIETRLDLAAARQESEVLARALGVTRDWRYFAVVDVGVNAERESDGQWLIGPEVGIELPLFDQRQAAVARAEAELRRADQRVIEVAVRVRSEIRAARERVVALRNLVEHYREVIIPLRESQVALTQQEYNFMLVGAFELILAKQAEYDSYQEYVEIVRDYWIARSEMERALGGKLEMQHGNTVTPQDLPPEDASREGHEAQQEG